MLPLCGKPLISWTIEASLASSYIDRTVVSTDDSEIVKLNEDKKVEIINRPAELATDESPTFPVVEHALSQIGDVFGYVALLQPTSPLRNQHHIDEAFERLIKKKADAVISICESDHSPLWSNILPEDGNLNNFLNADVKGIRSQDLPKYFRVNGAIFIIKVNKLLEEKSFYLKSSIYSYIMSKQHSVDIDDRFDFILAESIMNSIRN